MEDWNNGRLESVIDVSIHPSFHIHTDNQVDKLINSTKCYIIAMHY